MGLGSAAQLGELPLGVIAAQQLEGGMVGAAALAIGRPGSG